MPLVLRQAIASDVPEVVALEQACYGDPWPATAFAALPDNHNVYFAVARDGEVGALVGYVVGWYVLDEGELANLAVAPPMRGRGVGRALLGAMLEEAVRRGALQVFLEVRESNGWARKLYDERGFEQIGTRKGYYRNPVEDALILRCTLNS